MNHEILLKEPIRLTQFSHGAGCGCKIAPAMLEEILKSNLSLPADKLLVGNSSKDDAAVFDTGSGFAIISTTDFFMPIVDDAFDFGKIAAANSISDVYAMGGKPLLAIAILGWPVEKLPASLAQKVIDGGRTICMEAGISLAGGHSIDSPEPFFGLCVTGTIPVDNIKRNNTAQEGDLLFITKPLGTGILSTAQKRGLLKENLLQSMIDQMTRLNKVGEELGKIKEVSSMTDVTGFGLLGHLIEIAEGSGLSAELEYNRLPLMEGVKELIKERVFPDATTRNWSGYGNRVRFEKGVNVMEAFTLLPDPQTNGGLLFSVNESAADKIKSILNKAGLEKHIEPIGRIISRGEKTIEVKI